MRKNEWRSVLVRCPFYKHESATSISCVGINRDEGIMRTFARRDRMKQCRRRFCEEKFEACPIFRMLLNVEKHGGRGGDLGG